ncbi:pyrroloquinoline quinone biosynthesis protein PqqB [Rhizobium halophytocola]|uniref:Coenzyme PQQ synthesis protein B n=1 Tax=Rhizobium halophytocola TaxID=735519 RepID=A0ABS4DXC4_9HYPH|nr:pyrroloquinoline quinone biosynthesis protein PqqB [Rhizobium halophytocola]MBP1850342.1 pyrroloquinoline quinone biosynthesis protein B [Rhizobium halophytocola]
MASIRFLVLGAAAGGGLPQWNCGCVNCRAARDPAAPLMPQTQSSLAASVDGENWVLFNASPDLRTQIEHNRMLHPKDLRDSPIRSVVLTNGDVDHIAGLLTLREKQEFSLFATPGLQALLAAHPVFGVLDPALVAKIEVDLETDITPLAGLTVRLFAVPGKVPLYQETSELSLDQETDQTVGVELCAGGRRAYYIPGCGRMTEALARRIDGADIVFFDGTLFTDDEMIRAGTGLKTGRRMGHMPITGDGGSLEALGRLAIGRRLYIHINNTNPIWRAGPERAAVEAAGFTICHDGLEVILDAQFQ